MPVNSANKSHIEVRKQQVCDTGGHTRGLSGAIRATHVWMVSLVFANRSCSALGLHPNERSEQDSFLGGGVVLHTGSPLLEYSVFL